MRSKSVSGKGPAWDQPTPVFTFCTSTLVSSHLEWTLLSGNWRDLSKAGK